MKKSILTGLLFVAATFAASSALAVEPAPTAGHGSVGALFGYGFKDGANLGFGVRGGYTLPANVYLGGTFVYHLGKSTDTPYGSSSVNLFYLGAEGGYDFAAGPVVIRPYLGLGMASVRVKTPEIDMGPLLTMPATSASESRFAAWPGATLLYPIDNFFVGADARFLIVSDVNAFSLFATGGLQF
jgi:hypothetical protein